jgi:hypothetical protein
VAAKELCRRYCRISNTDCISYELFVGCSTGSLLMPHLALGKIDKIKVSTPLSQKRHFNLCPFIVKKTKNGIETKSTTSI